MKGLHYLRLNIRRGISFSAFPTKRMPLPEELFEKPIVNTKVNQETNRLTEVEIEMQDPSDVQAQIKGFHPPVLHHQLEASLSHRFRHHIIKTDWSLYRDPLEEAEREQAAQLLQQTMMSLREFGFRSPSTVASADEKFEERLQRWLKEECKLMEAERKTGDTRRWEGESLVGRQRWTKWSEERRRAVRPALKQIAANPSLHPRVKRKILANIADIIEQTIE